MAHLDNTIFGKLKGKVGKVVYYTVNGVTYIRSQPEKIKNPRTPLQEQQRNRLRDAMIFYKTIHHTPLKTIWQTATYGQNITSANLFIKMNIAAFFGDGKVTDYSKLHFSCGNLPQSDRFQARYFPETEWVEVRWQTKGCMHNRRYEDRLMAVVMYEDDEFEIIADSLTAPSRREEVARLPVQTRHGSPRYVYCFFAAPDGRSYSNDICCSIDN
ncbi:DUF6266 family protein [Bacteroides caecimuris]|uniref:DUF6266 family protein n=1 Tax=Bacteroides caecimuris TaxID=1796613 RepID=UPI00242AB48F|nr:DUF6266 family protein [Bacteroides caecimuris]